MTYPNESFYLGGFALADALLTPLLRGAARAAVAAARALHRAACVRDERRIASVLGIPSPETVRALWTPPRRTLRQALLVGSKLADLTPTHPATLRRSAPDARGRRRLAGRDGGLKRYFATSLPDLPYSTAMRYRRLALRVLRALGTPAAIPLEWLLGAAAPEALTGDAALAEALRVGRRELADLLAGIRTQRDLARRLDRRPDSDRLPLSSRSKDALQESAICEEMLRRAGEKLEAAVAGGKSLTSAEKRAWALLKRLRGVEKLFAKR